MRFPALVFFSGTARNCSSVIHGASLRLISTHCFCGSIGLGGCGFLGRLTAIGLGFGNGPNAFSQVIHLPSWNTGGYGGVSGVIHSISATLSLMLDVCAWAWHRIPKPMKTAAQAAHFLWHVLCFFILSSSLVALLFPGKERARTCTLSFEGQPRAYRN